MNDQKIDIIIPTWNNFDQLAQMVMSVTLYRGIYPMHLIIVNNGEPEMSDLPFFDHPDITVLTPGENLGWEGALKLGLEHSKSEFVMFANDDIYIPECSKTWISKLLQPFHDSSVGAVGPATNVAMGPQGIFNQRNQQAGNGLYQVPYLIGFCMLLRRSALDKAGGVDDSLPGGDDLDLSMRLIDAGYRLILDASTFVYHWGFSTGTRVYGNHTKPGGWNSPEMGEKTNQALIRKHGLKRWHQCVYGQFTSMDYQIGNFEGDVEGDLVRSLITGNKVVELGVGGNKTVKGSIGVDEVPKGEVIPILSYNTISEADVVADVTEPLPFKDGEFDTLIARHILEHCQDTLKTLRQWAKVVQSGGKIFVVVPNQQEGSTIPMNPEHLHSFTPESIKNLAEAAGLQVLEVMTHYNLVSLCMLAQKP